MACLVCGIRWGLPGVQAFRRGRDYRATGFKISSSLPYTFLIHSCLFCLSGLRQRFWMKRDHAGYKNCHANVTVCGCGWCWSVYHAWDLDDVSWRIGLANTVIGCRITKVLTRMRVIFTQRLTRLTDKEETARAQCFVQLSVTSGTQRTKLGLLVNLSRNANLTELEYTIMIFGISN